MPVSRLLVEGKLDAILLSAFLGGNPPVEPRGSKNSLKPITAEEMSHEGPRVAFVRDRDFDFDPPLDEKVELTEITDTRFPEPLGWYWSRHEIENYLLDPAIIQLVWPSVSRHDYESMLVKAAVKIRFYEAARWAVGIARRALPPHYELRTRPAELCDRELAVPAWFDMERCQQWAVACIGEHCNRLTECLSVCTAVDVIERMSDHLAVHECSDCKKILTWFSGKDLLCALAPEIERVFNRVPGSFRARIRDWIMQHPEEAVRALPPWDTLRGYVRQ